MTIFYNIRFRFAHLAIPLAIVFFCSPIGATDYKSVLEAVDSARSHGLSDEVLNLLLAYSVEYAQGPEHTVHVIQLLSRIQKTGISLVPFQVKIREGAVKRVDPQKLENALNQLFDDYKFVDSLLIDKLTESEVQSGEIQTMFVKSLELGLDRRELRQLIEKSPAAPPEMLAVAAQNKAFLKQIAFDDVLTDEILSAGLSRQNLTNQWSLFYRLAAVSKKKGLSDSQIAQAAIDTLKQNGNLRQVLTKLHFILRDVRHGPHQEPLEDGTEEH